MYRIRVKVVTLTHLAGDDAKNEGIINDAISNIENYPGFEKINKISYINHLALTHGSNTTCGAQAIIEYYINDDRL